DGVRSAWVFFFFQAEDGIRDLTVTGVQTCALPIFEERTRLLARPALDGLRHHARRSLRDGAARPDEADFADDALVHPQIDRELVAAQRVEAFGGAVRAFESLEVARLLVVVEYDLLVKLAQFRHKRIFDFRFLICD